MLVLLYLEATSEGEKKQTKKLKTVGGTVPVNKVKNRKQRLSGTAEPVQQAVVHFWL